MNLQGIFFKTVSVGPRTQYVVEEMFSRRCGLKVTILSPSEDAPEGGVTIHHGIPGGDLHFPYSGILLEKNQTQFSCQPEILWQESKLGSTDHHSVAGDLPGLVFWFLSRYEEQKPGIEKDKHGRFPTKENTSVKKNLASIPLVDKWMRDLGLALEKLGLTITPPPFETRVSFDLDNLSAFRHKGMLRTGGAALKDLMTGNMGQFWNRVLVGLGRAKDPFENTNFLLETLRKHQIKTQFFVWVGNYGPQDKGLDFKSAFLRTEIQKISKEQTIGLHPSYASFLSLDQLKKEKERLEEIIGKPVNSCRFHYLRFDPRVSYQHLEFLGFTSDHSMGFSEIPGFRAGTSVPFFWYDFKKERTSALTLFPFAGMDSGSHFLRKENLGTFLSEAHQLGETAKSIGGSAEIIFHNEFPSWPGWENALDLHLQSAGNLRTS